MRLTRATAASQMEAARSMRREKKSVHSRTAEGVRLRHGTTRKLPDTSLQVYQPTKT